MKLRPDVRDTAHRLVTAGYRLLAKEFHPDIGGDKDEMTRVNDAASCLRAMLDGRWTPMPTPEPPPSGWTMGRTYTSTIDGRISVVVDIEPATCVKATSKAICCQLGQEDMWFPYSQLGDRSEVRREGDRGRLTISKWIAQQKGLI